MGTRKFCESRISCSGRAGANPLALNPLIGGDLLGSYQTTKAIGRWLAFPPKLAREIGIEETIFLLNIAFCANPEEEWVLRTWREIEEETTLSLKQQKRVRKRLEKLGLIRRRINRVEHQTFYKVVETDFDALIEKLGAGSKRAFVEGTKGTDPPVPKVLSSKVPKGPSFLREEFKKEQIQEEPPPPSVSKFEEQMQEKREHKEKREARKRGERVYKNYPSNRSYSRPAASATPRPITAKQPESWIWFSRLFKHLSDVNAVTMPELWPMVDEMVEEIGKEEAEDRLSIYLDGSAKVSGYLAKDFLCGGWKTIDPEEYHLPRIQNEEGT
jgi:hypothetical protein